MKPLRVIFMGTPDFAVPTLRALVQAGHEVLLVVAQPDRKAGRGQQLRSPPVVECARELGLPTAQPKALRSGPFPERFVSLQADVAVVIAYGRILPLPLLQAPTFGCVNVHASLLPRWRGAAPIHFAIAQGDQQTGVCTQQMEEGLDTGPVYLSKATPIGARETTGELHDRLALLGADLALQTLAGLGELQPQQQPEEGITWATKISRESGLLNLELSAVEVDRVVRAMTPWPGGWLPWKDGPLKILETELCEGRGEPGEILGCRPDLIVACSEGALVLRKVKAPGRKAVSGTDFAHGARLSPGRRLQWPS